MYNGNLKINDKAYKIGVNEIAGLKDFMVHAMKPLQDYLKESSYWSDTIELHEAEYTSRDGFIPYSHNCGGMVLTEHLPKCERYNFDFVDFGECYIPEDCKDEEHECDEHCDAYLKIWLKFEGLDENGVMQFYLVMSGGNEDAPYFRDKYLPTLFEDSFNAKSLPEFKRNAKVSVSKLLKLMKGA
jgi:hypothetical protein